MAKTNNQMEILIEQVNKSSRPFEKAIIGQMCLDTLVICPEKNLMRRPWLTILMDESSRRVLGFYLSFSPPTYVSNMMVIRECVKKYSLLPNSIAFNGGKEYKSEQFFSLLATLGITAHINPKNDENKYYFEMLFRTINNFVICAQYRSQWFLENLNKSLAMLLYEVYDTTPNLVLGNSPRDFYMAFLDTQGDMSQRFISYDKEFKLLTCPIIERKVIQGRGIRNNNFSYWTREFMQPDLDCKKVKVKYDPVDKDIAFAFINGNWKKLTRVTANEIVKYLDKEV